tara:strand:+ start:3463 stop:3978 length:516 start_codon:yes stop_codon:yes gene_type:complete
MPFLVGAGPLSDSAMSSGSIALKAFWGDRLLKFTCMDSPDEVLSALPKNDLLFQLSGDAGFYHSENGSWLECLGAWKMPVILMATPSDQGEIPGTAAAYVALCYKLLVPLVGIVQLGGEWHPKARAKDGLPWCGCLPSDETGNGPGQDSVDPIDTLIVTENLKRRLKSLNL